MNIRQTPDQLRIVWSIMAVVLVTLFSAACNIMNPTIKVTPDKQEDKVSVSLIDDQAIILVESESGIGGLETTLKRGAWPGEVTIQLHTRGLEHLEIAYGNRTVVTSVSSTSDPGPEPTLYVTDENGNTEETVNPPAEFVSRGSIISTRGEPQIPLEDGYFEFGMPADFYQGNYDSFTLQWIDFYR